MLRAIEYFGSDMRDINILIIIIIIIIIIIELV